ncbi:MAG TPA: lysozyme [Polymorphobacter sp.]|jgi:GH24 family phage-related lysozyme (muramidase)|nr:lysozyme [Polymorphobacter sp.]
MSIPISRHPAATAAFHLPSAAAIALIKSFEKCRLHAYLPTPDDVPTIGWGSTRDSDGSRIRLGQVWTQAQADTVFNDQLLALAREIGGCLAQARTSQPQFDALVSFAYNLGAAALARSTLLALHRAGDFAGAAAQFARWNRQGKTVLPGLARRRAAEAALYRTAA